MKKKRPYEELKFYQDICEIRRTIGRWTKDAVDCLMKNVKCLMTNKFLISLPAGRQAMSNKDKVFTIQNCCLQVYQGIQGIQGYERQKGNKGL